NRGVEQAARLKLLHQRGGRLISLAAAIDEVLRDALVVVPDLAVDEELHETDAALDEAAGDQATGAVFARDGIVQAVEFLRGLALLGQIEATKKLYGLDVPATRERSEEHTSVLQSRGPLV